MERYEAYKESGVEWIGEIPEHWTRVRVGSLFYMKGRIGWQGLKAEEFIDTGPYLVTGTDFENGHVNWKTCYHISQERFDEAPEIHVKNGDLLITKDGTIGKLALICGAPKKVSLNSHLLLLRPLSETVSNRFLFWVLSSGEFSHYTEISQSGTIMASLSQDKISRFMYGCPNLNEQQAIADYLDVKTTEIDALVADCEWEVGLLREYRKAVISEAVTKGLDPDASMKDSGVEWIGEIPSSWESNTISGVTTMITNGYVGPTRNLFVENGVRYLQSLHIVNGALDFEKHPYYVTDEWSTVHSRSILKEGDVLVVQTGAIGNCAFVDEAFAGCNCHALIVLRPDKAQINGRFLYYYLSSDIGKEKMLLTRTGATHPHLNSTKIKFTHVVVPPMGEQNQLIEYLDAKTAEIDSLIEAKRSMADKLREYRKSLISEAVTGKFKVPGVDE